MRKRMAHQKWKEYIFNVLCNISKGTSSLDKGVTNCGENQFVTISVERVCNDDIN